MEKQCSRCKKTKPHSEYGKRKEMNDGLRSDCRKCRADAARAYQRTELGLITLLYAHQRSHSKTRGHEMPSYSLDQLREWALSQAKFKELYTAWVESGFSKMRSPSIDRLDDFSGYSLENIRLTDWAENKAKSDSHKALALGSCGVVCHAVEQLTMGGEFIAKHLSREMAAAATGISSCAISNCAMGRSATSGGFVWRNA